MLIAFLSLATPVDFTGYLVDTLCWSYPNHEAPPTRNTPLAERPYDHTLECLRDISFCFDDLKLLAFDNATQRYDVKFEFSASRNPDGLKALQALLKANTSTLGDATADGPADTSLTVANGAPDLSYQNGGHRMAPVHLEAVAADDDAGALTDVRVNVEGRSEVYTKDSVPDGGGGGDGASFGDGTLTVTWRLRGAGDAAAVEFSVGLKTDSLGWLALGVSADGTMDSSGAGSDVVICSGDDGSVARYWVTQKASPPTASPSRARHARSPTACRR